MANYGELISKQRKSKGFSQAQLAEMLFVSPQAVSKWENNHSEPDLATLKKISEILDIPVDRFFEVTGETLKSSVETTDQFYCWVTGKELNSDEMYEFEPVPISKEGKEMLDKEEAFLVNHETRDLTVKMSNVNKKQVSFIVGTIIGFILMVIFVISAFTNETTPTPVADAFIAGVFGLLLITFLSQMFYDSWLRGDFFFAFIGKTIRMPGLIFELSIDGVIWLIIVKGILWFITIIFTVVVFLLGFLISLVVSPFSYIYELINIRKVDGTE